MLDPYERTKMVKELLEKWPYPVVCRSDVGKFSGGILHDRTMANLDSKGEGPPRTRVGRKVVYRTEDLALWMANRAERVK